MAEQKNNHFWINDPSYWYGHLNSSAAGISQVEAQRRLRDTTGRRPTRSAFVKDVLLFLSQFKSPMMLLLIGAVIISGFLGDVSDVVIILFIVLSSGLLSFFQERNAGKVVEKLQSMITIRVTVLRDGQPHDVPADDVVPGDVLLLNAGDMLPADCLVIESNELHANESTLTGEAYPVKKLPGVVSENTPLAKRTNCLWEGTNIVSGDGKALVISTGSETVFGTIAADVSGTVETTFEKGIRDFGYFLMKITVVLAVFILIMNLLNHKSIIDSALFALALAVGMAPELLPAITTIAMSAGARRLLARKVIVKKLNSIQNLGEVNLLCTDKTGTITEGVIKVAGMLDSEGKESEFVRLLALKNATHEGGYANPIDTALRLLKKGDEDMGQKLGEVPYDFNRKRLSIAVRSTHESLFISKGAFTQIVGICSQVRLSDGKVEDIAGHRDRLQKNFEQFGAGGSRAIAVCYKVITNEAVTVDLETQMIFAGFLLLKDPVKAGIPQTINELQSLDVALKIITGDNRKVAESIARSIGISDPVIMTAADLEKLSKDEINTRVKSVHVFAEVEPQQKENIILALKHHFSVAYMGDGINDVTAINAADVGISVDNAVDAAREAADFVLMEKDLMVLADGIREGRKTFANTLKYLYISTGSTFGNMCSIAVASVILPFLPMLPKQILLINYLTDFPFLTVTTDNVDKEQLESPGKWNLKMIRNYMVIFGIHSSVFDMLTFFTLYYFLKVSVPAFQTGWFIESVLTELFILFVIRTHQSFVKSKPGKYLFILGLVALVATLLLPYSWLSDDVGMIPLPANTLLIVLAIVLLYVITADLLKVWFFRRNKYLNTLSKNK